MTTGHDDEVRDDRPLADLVRDLSQQGATLVRQEIELARSELAAKARQGMRGAALLGGAGVLALAGVGAVVACLVLALALAVPGWAAALAVAVLAAAGAGLLVAAGVRRLREAVPPVPERTVETMKDNVEWLRTRT